MRAPDRTPLFNVIPGSDTDLSATSSMDFDDDARPQTRLDRDAGDGQAISIGRLRPDALFDWRFVALSHNTVRGAAGGAGLTAELLAAEGYLTAK